MTTRYLEEIEQRKKLKKIFEEPMKNLRRRFVTRNGIEVRWIGDERLDPNDKGSLWPIQILIVKMGRMYNCDLLGRAHPSIIQKGWDIKEILPFREGDSLETAGQV